MKLIIYILLLVQLKVSAQAFVQINQTPLLYHPSFAGAKGKGRLSWAGNLLSNDYNSYKTQRVNNYFSYDDLWKKKGIGWGASVLSSNSDGGDKNSPYDHRTNHQYGVNIYFSTKHTIFHATNKNPKYTISPSLSLGYAKGHLYERLTFSYGGYLNSFTYLVDNKTFKSTLGLLFNTPYGHLGVSGGLSYRIVDDIYPRFSATFENGTFILDSTKFSQFYPTFTIVFARTFFSKTNSFFTLTPSGYISFSSFYNHGYHPWNSSYNLTATFGKIYVGAGVGTGLSTQHNVFGGFQNDKFRTGISCGWNPRNYSARSLWELSFSYFFKSPAE